MLSRSRIPLLFPGLLFCAAAGGALAESPRNPVRLEVTPGIPDPAEILFTPPPPPQPVPAMRVDSAVVRQVAGHRITVVRGEPSALPDIPVPPVAARSAEPVDFSGPAVKSFFIGMSVTVYDHRISQVKWSDPETGERHEAWCGWDWELLSPIQQVEGEGVSYGLFFSPLHEQRSAAFDLPEGEFRLTQGNPESPCGEALIAAMQSFHAEHRTRLHEVLAARQRCREEAVAWKKANPPTAQNHTVWLRPHRGSRYLREAAGTITQAAGGKEESR